MKSIILVSSLFSLVLFSSCSKPIPPVPVPKYQTYPTQYMAQEFKDYTNFKAGSYWIYQNKLTPTITDSIIVMAHHTFLSQGPEGKIEEFYDTLFSSQDGYFNVSGTGEYTIDDPKWQRPEVTYFTASIIGAVEPSEEILNYTDSLTTMTEGPVQYKDVKGFTAELSGRPDSYAPLKRIYWADHIGIIEKVTQSDISWSLIRYHVSQ